MVCGMMKGTTGAFLEAFSQRSSFKKNRHEKLYKIHGKTTVIESFHE